MPGLLFMVLASLEDFEGEFLEFGVQRPESFRVVEQGLPGVSRSPYKIKTQPSTADVAAKLRCIIIAGRFKASHSDQPTHEEIRVIRLA